MKYSELVTEVEDLGRKLSGPSLAAGGVPAEDLKRFIMGAAELCAALSNEVANIVWNNLDA